MARRYDGMCPRCDGKRPKRPKQGVCLECHAAWMRDRRKRHRDLSPEERFKANSRSYANVYQRRGKIIPEDCTLCGMSAEKHHEDYSKPLEVVWVCRPCHLRIHQEAS